ncbi:MAG: aminopeptidase, partial [Clostridiaceae bacterium]|nr:aminopeptidase [Clostridiaceae bacterium]
MSEQDKKKMDEADKLRKKLTFSFKNLWDPENENEMKAVMAFGEDYKKALDRGKTEREFVDFAVGLLQSEGYREYQTDKPLKAGDRVYETVHGKGIVAAVIGTADPLLGFN